MRTFSSMTVVLLVVGAAGIAAAAQVDAGAPFGMLELVDEVRCGDPSDPHPLIEDPVGGSTTTTLLGQPARLLAPDHTAKLFAYNLGGGKGLVAGQAYLLVVEFPDDLPRTVVVVNRGADFKRAFSTGTAIGDAREQFAYPSPESMKYPQSQTWQSFRQLFYLHEHIGGLKGIRSSSDSKRQLGPADGFLVSIGQFRDIGNPLESGAAVGRIRLFAIDNPQQYDVPMHFPPSDLPRRHLFWREEMADEAIGATDPLQRAFSDPVKWYEAKVKLAKFLGMNTFSKDLLEFGHVQGWDTTIHGGNAWNYMSGVPELRGLWANILDMVGKNGLDVLPYYEYKGAIGSGMNGDKSLGIQHRCRPLSDRTNDFYTGVTWTEPFCVDITDPETLADAKLLLDATILQYQMKAPFIGAWFRTRVTSWPVSFTDAAIARFSTQANSGTAVTRADLKADPTLLTKYYAWYFDQRKNFVIALRDYLRAGGVAGAELLITSYHPESLQADGVESGVVTDDMPTWAALNALALWKNRYPPRDFMAWLQAGKFATAQLRMPLPTPTQLAAASVEDYHATPPADPDAYKSVEGVMMTLPFSRLFTVADAALMERFRSQNGLAMVRHFALNEDQGSGDSATTGNPSPMDGKLGYFDTDVDRAGPYSMLAEARAVANGDPRYIGYLASTSFSRGFPEYSRAFNAAFLALPASPSTVIAGAASNSEVVVREIKTANHGTYYAVVNTAMTDKKAVNVTLPASGMVEDLVSGDVLTNTTFDLYPGQLLALHVGELIDVNSDGGTTNHPMSPGGCACQTSGNSSPPATALALLILAYAVRRRLHR